MNRREIQERKIRAWLKKELKKETDPSRKIKMENELYRMRPRKK